MDKIEFIELLEDGLLRESQVSRYLMDNIISSKEKHFLLENGLDIPMILNGKYHYSLRKELVKLAHKWNDRLGSIVIFPDDL
jgi:hypothetical protein